MNPIDVTKLTFILNHCIGELCINVPFLDLANTKLLPYKILRIE